MAGCEAVMHRRQWKMVAQYRGLVEVAIKTLNHGIYMRGKLDSYFSSADYLLQHIFLI